MSPKTGKRFRKWDEDGAGNIFWRYRDKVRKSDGFLLEDWRTEETLPRPRPKPERNIIINAPRRLNPKTEQEVRLWDRDIETKKVFWNYEDKKPVVLPPLISATNFVKTLLRRNWNGTKEIQ